MENFSIELPPRVFYYVKRNAELHGRSIQDELVYGLMMQFDPEFAQKEMDRMIQNLLDQQKALVVENDDDLDLMPVDAETMHRALVQSFENNDLTEKMRRFLAILCKNDDYLTDSDYGYKTNLHSNQIRSLRSWLTRYLKGISGRPYTWKNYTERNEAGQYRMPHYLREAVRTFLENH